MISGTWRLGGWGQSSRNCMFLCFSISFYFFFNVFDFLISRAFSSLFPKIGVSRETFRKIRLENWSRRGILLDFCFKMELLEASWNLLEPPWSLLELPGAFWTFPGASWSFLEAPGLLEPSWEHPGASWTLVELPLERLPCPPGP